MNEQKPNMNKQINNSDMIKLTAQFVARNGQHFQMGLLNREQKNSQFDFLKPGKKKTK